MKNELKSYLYQFGPDYFNYYQSHSESNKLYMSAINYTRAETVRNTSEPQYLKVRF